MGVFLYVFYKVKRKPLFEKRAHSCVWNTQLSPDFLFSSLLDPVRLSYGVVWSGPSIGLFQNPVKPCV